jgi:exosortase/archaeosortase family protein
MAIGQQLLPPVDGQARPFPGTVSEGEALIRCQQGAHPWISRNELFAGLAVLCLANGISGRVTVAVIQDGIVTALLATFNISVIVWGACAIGISFLLRGPVQPIRAWDRMAAGWVLAAILVPIGPLSWLALVGLGLYILRGSPRSSSLHRGACILLAMTVPMFWGRLVFAMLSDVILQGDAILVGWLVGTPRLGNTIQFPDGSGYLWIAPGCSSLANISLVILCWVTFTKVLDRPSSLQDVGWCLAGCAAVVVINVVRISLIGFYPERYDLIHGPIGLTVASWAIFAVTVGICLLGVRRDLPTRA